jgi:hypothetical protein
LRKLAFPYVYLKAKVFKTKGRLVYIMRQSLQSKQFIRKVFKRKSLFWDIQGSEHSPKAGGLGFTHVELYHDLSSIWRGYAMAGSA